jgi:hypothetical protein
MTAPHESIHEHRGRRPKNLTVAARAVIDDTLVQSTSPHLAITLLVRLSPHAGSVVEAHWSVAQSALISLSNAM